MDLSKPIQPEAKTHEISKEELNALSGETNAQSQMLNDIIAQKGSRDSAKGYRGLPMFTTESDSESTPFPLAKDQHDGKDKGFSDLSSQNA